jgi:hypothetical protein
LATIQLKEVLSVVCAEEHIDDERIFLSFPAKKLKQTWVETKKIKQRWAAEKRRLGLVEQMQGMDGVEEEEEEEWKGIDWDAAGEEKEKEHAEESDVHVPPPAHVRIRNISHQKRRRELSEEHDETSVDTAPTFREKAREAYSKFSLHSYKSKPVDRKRSASRGAEYKGTGRGQPNMKLRMDVLLEKIKRDFV